MTGSKFPVVIYFFLSNDFPVILQVFIHIHEYANEMFFIFGHQINKFVKLYHLWYKNIQCKPLMFSEQELVNLGVFFTIFPHFKVLTNIYGYLN